jgi:hypothetical protein
LSDSRPPLRARLHWYKLTGDELVLLQAMVEHCSDGSTIWASVPRLAAYSKLSERKVQRLIHGEERNGRHIPGLCDRGILSKLASGNAAKRRPATYRLNEDALEEDPRMGRYRNRQQQLPGIGRRPVPGEPIPDHPLVSGGHQSGVPGAADLVSSGHQSGVTGTPDPKAFDPSTFDPSTTDSEREKREIFRSTRKVADSQRANLWAEKNSYAYRAFCRGLEEVSRASIGVYQFDYEEAALKAAHRAGVPTHIALALLREEKS